MYSLLLLLLLFSFVQYNTLHWRSGMNSIHIITYSTFSWFVLHGRNSQSHLVVVLDWSVNVHFTGIILVSAGAFAQRINLNTNANWINYWLWHMDTKRTNCCFDFLLCFPCLFRARNKYRPSNKCPIWSSWFVNYLNIHFY